MSTPNTISPRQNRRGNFSDTLPISQVSLPEPSFARKTSVPLLIPCLRNPDMTCDLNLHELISQSKVMAPVKSLGVCHRDQRVNLNFPTLMFLHWRLECPRKTSYKSLTSELGAYLNLISKLC